MNILKGILSFIFNPSQHEEKFDPNWIHPADRCRAQTRKGNQCKRKALPAETVCYQHSWGWHEENR